MTLFDEYVHRVLTENLALTNQRLTVEKELFHQDILRLINETGIMKKLVFIGGTCLRLCYASGRLSEDLDFSASSPVSEEEASVLADTIRDGLAEKYKLEVEVSKPSRSADTKTWKIKIVTHPGHNNIPTQQIHVDITSYKSYMNEIRLVRNAYSVGNSSQLFVRAEKLEEILIDKLIAFAFRNRIKNRDLWDIYSLYCENINLQCEILRMKLNDRGRTFAEFTGCFKNRADAIKTDFPSDFKDELSRFLSPGIFSESILSKPEGPAAFNTILSDYLKVLEK